MQTTHLHGDTCYHVHSDPARGLLSVSHTSGALIARLNTRALILLGLAPHGLKALDEPRTALAHHAAFLLTVCGTDPDAARIDEACTSPASSMLEACPA